jgi:ABC-type multidrug transport system fused ATPase/permease subunit
LLSRYYIEQLAREPALATAADKQPPADWPHAGRVEFRDVVLSCECAVQIAFVALPAWIGAACRPPALTSLLPSVCCCADRDGLEPALKGLSVSILGGERIGVVGRTGAGQTPAWLASVLYSEPADASCFCATAGKSTLATALFRLREVSAGSVLVDGVDLATLGLDDVRGRTNGLAIIPQVPACRFVRHFSCALACA